MGRLLSFLGVLLMLIAIGGMGLSFLAPVGDLLTSVTSPMLGASLCREGEEYVQENSPTTTRRGGRANSLRMFCIDDDGTRREVTDEYTNSTVGQIFGGVGTFSILIIISVALMVIGSLMTASARRRQAQQPFGVDWTGNTVVRHNFKPGATTVVTVNGQPQTEIPPEMQDLVHQAMQMAEGMSNFQFQTTNDDSDLTTKLRELKEAHDAGLISQTEYDRLRQQILDSMA